MRRERGDVLEGAWMQPEKRFVDELLNDVEIQDGVGFGTVQAKRAGKIRESAAGTPRL